MQNVKCNKFLDFDALDKDFKKKHLKNKKLLLDKNQGVFVEDLLDNRCKYRQYGGGQSQLKELNLPKLKLNEDIKTKNTYRISKSNIRNFPTTRNKDDLTDHLN